MAKTKSNPPVKETFKQEKIEKVEVKKLLRDERTHKIAGSVCILLTILLFIAFTSYLFTWDEDQDKVFSQGYRLLIGTDTKVANLMGTFGAFISHFFIYKGFGIASYLLCSLFFVAGINLFFGKKIFSLLRNIKYLIIGVPLISLTASVIMNGNAFPWGGAAGDMVKDWMYKTVGEIGTIGIILVSFLAYIIWRFNPAFRLLKANKNIEENAASLVIDTSVTNGAVATDEMNDTRVNGNNLKGTAGMLDIPDQSNPLLNHDLTIIEKETEIKKPAKQETKLPEEITILSAPPEKILTQKNKPVTASGLALEINAVEPKSSEEITAAEKVAGQKPYDQYWICVIINIHLPIYLKTTEAKKLCRMQMSLKIIRTRSSTRFAITI